MSQKSIFREEVNQPSIRLFVGSSSDDCLEQTSTSTNTDEWYEHISKPRRRRASRKFRDSKQTKLLSFDSPPTPLSTDPPTKKRTPPSIEKQPIKRSHQDNTDTPRDPTMEPQNAEGDQCKKTQELVEMEARMLTTIRDMINPIQVKIDNLFITKEEWDEHKEEVCELKKSNTVLTNKMEKLEVVNQNLDERLKLVEDRIGGVNIIISGLAENPWEQDPVTMDRVYDVLSETIDNWNYQHRIERAKKMEILRVKRLGKFNKMRGRPVLATLMRQSDADFVISNRKRLPKKVYVDYEYDEEVEKSRRFLRPILNEARKIQEYKGKCKLEGGFLIINSVKYNKDNIHELPLNICGSKVSSTHNDNVLGFFGELSPFSNFYPCKFTHDGITYHSGEQFIQRQKALLFKNNQLADEMLSAPNALTCKKLSKTVTNYDVKKWVNSAIDLCTPGLYSKFDQDAILKGHLIGTGDRKIVESSRDKVWGTGVPLRDDRCLVESSWHTQGLLGKILTHIRERLKTELRNEVQEANTIDSNTHSVT